MFRKCHRNCEKEIKTDVIVITLNYIDYRHNRHNEQLRCHNNAKSVFPFNTDIFRCFWWEERCDGWIDIFILEWCDTKTASPCDGSQTCLSRRILFNILFLSFQVNLAETGVLLNLICTKINILVVWISQNSGPSFLLKQERSLYEVELWPQWVKIATFYSRLGDIKSLA